MRFLSFIAQMRRVYFATNSSAKSNISRPGILLPFAGIAIELMALVIFALAPGIASANRAGPLGFDTNVMGTMVNLTIWSDDEGNAAEAANAVFAEFHRIDRLMSSWRRDSVVTNINVNAGIHPVVVDGETMSVIERALSVSRRSNGAFDITVGAFRGLWKFDEDVDGSIPDGKAVAAKVDLVNYRDVLIDPVHHSVMLRRPKMRITLGGVAKGYAVDRAADILRRRGFVDFVVHAGGDIYVSGRHGKRPWHLGIRDPRGAPGAIFAVADIKDASFSTSGDYERGFVKNGVRYHHIIDPATGYPANRSRSVTVSAPDAITADMWSTALFVLGPVKGLALVEELPGVDAVFVGADNRLEVSSGLKGRIRILGAPTAGP